LDAQYDLYEDIVARLFDGRGVLHSDTLESLAFRYFEQSKSRSLADALAQAEQSKKFDDKDSLFRIHMELQRQLLAVQNSINYELEKTPSSNEITVLRDEMVNIDRQIQNCKQAIEEKYPGYFNVKYGYSTPSLAEVQRSLNEHGQVALEFFWGSDWVYGMGISADRVIFKRIARPDSLRVTINKLLSHFNENTQSMDPANFESFVSSAHTLFVQMVKPFDSLLNGPEHLLIIPDGPVNQVPFEILLHEQKVSSNIDYRSLKYLIKTYSIGYAYSSAMLMRRNERVVTNPSLLAVGFTGGVRLRAPQPQLEEIIGAEEELEALSKRFKKGKFLVGPEATEANFKTLSPEYDIIHLAIHGRGDIERNLSSSLYFRTKYDSLDDGELHDYELYGLKLKALMAVLSACESGLGRDYKGEGMISMASAFAYSGCGNILMSLWKVNDKASTDLMDDFYGHLLEGKTIDNALRQAKLDYLDGTDELTSDPKIWAPLVAYGSLEPIFKKSNDRIFIYAAIGVVLLLAILFMSRRRRLI
jgi:CHAT domain-containing protein